MTQFISRAYNSFEVDKNSGAILYKRSKESRLADEADYYLHLPKELSIYFPRVVSNNVSDGIIELGLEYYAYDNLGNLMINHQFDANVWENVFLFIMKFLRTARTHTISTDGTEDCRLMYINKTENEYKKLVEQFPFFQTEIEDHEHITLNGQKLMTFKTMWPKLKEYISQNYFVNSLNYIHGDMCFSNILYGKNNINGDVVLKFIDPRGSFGNTKHYGDFYYDLAKIMHSCDGRYEYFITDNFSVNQLTSQTFELIFKDNNNELITDTLFKLLKEYEFDADKVYMLQGLIFIGMCARHYDSFDRQKGMYLTGLRILNKLYANLF
jgi:hypothetical protein